MLGILLPLLCISSSAKTSKRKYRLPPKITTDVVDSDKRKENIAIIKELLENIEEEKDNYNENDPIPNGVASTIKRSRRKLQKISGKVNKIIKTGEDLYRESASVVKTGEDVIHQGKKIVHTLEDIKHGSYGETKDPIDVDDIIDDD